MEVVEVKVRGMKPSPGDWFTADLHLAASVRMVFVIIGLSMCEDDQLPVFMDYTVSSDV